MASNVPSTSVPLSIPNSSAPIADVTGDVALTTDDGRVVSGTVSLSGAVTKAWRYIFGTFVQTPPQSQGWASPTGQGSRASINANFTTTVSNPPTQAEVTALRNQVIALQKALAQLISDELSSRTIRS